MITLYQFEYSSFCLKTRMALKAKCIEYKIKNINPGFDQIEIFKLSGQKQVPIINDDNEIIYDSSEICEYLDLKTNISKLYPDDPKDLICATLIEDWADTFFATQTKNCLIQAALNDKELRIALLPNEIPSGFKNILNFDTPQPQFIQKILNLENENNFERVLLKLSRYFENNQYLIGENLSIADLAISAQLSLLKFPKSYNSKLANKGNQKFIENPNLNSLFLWRDSIEEYVSNISH